MSKLINWNKSWPRMLKGQNPFTDIQKAFNGAIRDFFNDVGMSATTEGEKINIFPSIDILDSKDRIKIEAELPGMGPENIEVTITGNGVMLKGEKQCSKHDQNQEYLLQEIEYGSYQRYIPLPDSVDPDKAKASFKKGMLWIEIPKKAGTVEDAKKLEIERVS